MVRSSAQGRGHGGSRSTLTFERLEDRVLLNGTIPAFFDGDIDLNTGTGTGPAGVIRVFGDDADDRSGYSVSCAGDVNADGYDDFLIGAAYASPAGRPAAGETYLLFGHGAAWSDTDFNGAVASGTAIHIFGDDESDMSGSSVSPAGDVNGDGYDDFLIGAHNASPAGGAGAGETYLVFGHSGPWSDIDFNAAVPSSTAIRVYGDDEGDYSGFSVSSAGDVNADGYDDFLIGAHWADPAGGSRAGETYLVFGHGGAWSDIDFNGAVAPSTAVRILGDDESDMSGASVSSAGDVNADGYDDFLIGAPLGDPAGGDGAGEAYLVFGHAGAWSDIDFNSAVPAGTAIRILGDDQGDESGWSVSWAGDVNADGYDDVLMGASGGDPVGGDEAGEAHLVFGHGGAWLDIDFNSPVSPSTAIRISGDDEDDHCGVSVSSAGDVNNDGYDDVLIGALDADPAGGSEAGETYLLFGHSGEWSDIDFNGAVRLSAALRIFGDDEGDRSGWCVSSAGDVNNDGYDDVLIAAYRAEPAGGTDAGESYLVFGRPTRAFNDRTDVSAGNGARNMVSADFNGDGRTDLAVVNTADNDVSVFLGQAGGTFGNRVDYAVGGTPRDIVAGDFNGDTRLDLAVANFADNDVSILWGLAGGGFGSRQDYGVGAGPLGIAAGDFNSDGRLDLATANYSDNTATLLCKHAAGGYFTGRRDFAVGNRPCDLAAADFNSDGRLDLAVANFLDNDVSVLWGLAGGGLGSRQDYAAGTAPAAIVAGDMNGDGRPDLAVSNYSDNDVSVLYKLETGGYFGYRLDVAVGVRPVGLAAHDLNGDGRLDLAVTNFGDNDVSVLWGLAGGGVGGRQDCAVGAGPVGIVAGDFNGDAWQDLAVANFSDDDVSVLLAGPGGLHEDEDYAVGGSPGTMISADFNQDGLADLAVVNAGHDDISVLYGQAAGGLGDRHDYATGDPFDIVSADFNGDGRLDLAVANYADNDVSVLWGLAGGGFGSRQDYAVGAGPMGIVAGDFNADGRVDLATANKLGDTVTVLYKHAVGGYFTGRRDIASGHRPYDLATADFNGDGRLDLAVANFADDSVSLLWGLSGGGFGSRQNYTVGAGPMAIVAGHFNDDGRMDLATADFSENAVSVLYKTAVGGYFGNRQDTPVGTFPMRLATADLDRDNRLDLAVTNYNDSDVSVLYGQPGGGLGGRRDILTGSLPVGVAAADFNSNDWPDLAVSSVTDHSIRLFYGQVDGAFGEPQGSGADSVRTTPGSDDPGHVGASVTTEAAVAPQHADPVDPAAAYAMMTHRTAGTVLRAAQIGRIGTVKANLRAGMGFDSTPAWSIIGSDSGRTPDHIRKALSRIGSIHALSTRTGSLYRALRSTGSDIEGGVFHTDCA